MNLMSCSFLHSKAILSVVPSEKTSRPVHHHNSEIISYNDAQITAKILFTSFNMKKIVFPVLKILMAWYYLVTNKVIGN
jgi:hypothetical protein